jgi:hypothetical protein
MSGNFIHADSARLTSQLMLAVQQILAALTHEGLPADTRAPSTVPGPVDGTKKSIDPKARLTRRRTAEALTEEGYPTKEKTLATKASRGGGPPYEIWCGRAMYQWGLSLSWARDRLSEPRRSTSEVDVISARTTKGRLDKGRHLSLGESTNSGASFGVKSDNPQGPLAATGDFVSRLAK